MLSPLEQSVLEGFPSQKLPSRLGIAVSGGGDSMALLVALHKVAQVQGTHLLCCTVDHRLRPEAAQEAADVGEFCASLGIAHTTLIWSRDGATGNIQNAARQARYDLMSNWALQSGLTHIALGHTLDDQAETVVMRLARASGVDGLAAMAPQRSFLGVNWLRPMLGVKRAELRAYLTEQGVDWVDDPSNDDLCFDRIKAREALAFLAPLGVTSEALSQVAAHMRQVQGTLDDVTYNSVQNLAQIRAGAISLEWDGLMRVPAEVQRRILLAALRWVSGSAYAPRGRSMATSWATVQTAAASATLDGCHLLRTNKALWIFREYAAVAELTAPQDHPWDGVWQATGLDTSDVYTVRALGKKGLADYPDWRAHGIPRAALLAMPVLWQGTKMVAAPLLENTGTGQLKRVSSRDTPFDAVFSH